jgi:hypothetical protein
MGVAGWNFALWIKGASFRGTSSLIAPQLIRADLALTSILIFRNRAPAFRAVFISRQALPCRLFVF